MVVLGNGSSNMVKSSQGDFSYHCHLPFFISITYIVCLWLKVTESTRALSPHPPAVAPC